jgi:hypothetical protein
MPDRWSHSVIACLGLAILISTWLVPSPLYAGEPTTEPVAAARPIAAELFADPAKYVGTRIEIYGLVIEADKMQRSFLLQDVSQRPLTVDAWRLPPIVAGDQVEIEGVLTQTAGGLVLVGTGVKRVQVVGGGGCG